MTYSEQLKDPRWQKLRLEIMDRDGFACKTCGRKNRTLNVHHKRYIKGNAPWEYAAVDLVTLCEKCHKCVHQIADEFKTFLCALRPEVTYGVVAVLNNLVSKGIQPGSHSDVFLAALQTSMAYDAACDIMGLLERKGDKATFKDVYFAIRGSFKT
jgi:hypothetical protein